MSAKTAKRRALAASSPSLSIVFEKKYSIPEAAPLLGLASKTLSDRVSQGLVGCYRVGRRITIGESEIARILQEGFTPAREKTA